MERFNARKAMTDNGRVTLAIRFAAIPKFFPPLQQPQPTIVKIDIDSTPETHEEQFDLYERKIRARPFHPKRKPEKSSFK